jgi:uncharacterized protein YbjQ (UPF0145 family)
MSRTGGVVMGVAFVLFAAMAVARDSVLHLPLADVLALPDAKLKMDGSVKFFLAGADHPRVRSQLGSDISNKKTSGVGKDDEEACRWAALSALLSFQESAKRHGANAVVNLVSYFKRREFQSSTEYECHAGGVVVGVTFKGDYASLEP